MLKSKNKKSHKARMAVPSKARISYEPEADVLMWEIPNQPIDYAQEVGNIVMHFNENNKPILVEILEASKFFNRARFFINKGKQFAFSEATLMAG